MSTIRLSLLPHHHLKARSAYYVAELPPSSNLRTTPLVHAPLALLTSVGDESLTDLDNDEVLDILSNIDFCSYEGVELGFSNVTLATRESANVSSTAAMKPVPVPAKAQSAQSTPSTQSVRSVQSVQSVTIDKFLQYTHRGDELTLHVCMTEALAIPLEWDQVSARLQCSDLVCINIFKYFFTNNAFKFHMFSASYQSPRYCLPGIIIYHVLYCPSQSANPSKPSPNQHLKS